MLGSISVRRRVADVPCAELLWQGRIHQNGLFAVRFDEPVGSLAARAGYHGYNGGTIRTADKTAIVESQAHVAGAKTSEPQAHVAGARTSRQIPLAGLFREVENVDVTVVVPTGRE